MMLVVFFVYFPDHNCLVIDPVYNIMWALRPRTSDNIVGVVRLQEVKGLF